MDVSLASGGETLRGWFIFDNQIPARTFLQKNDRPTIVFFHENALNIGYRL